ncbi:MAG: hypothetical protein WC141_09185 [Arcobacteraceae bacterium]
MKLKAEKDKLIGFIAKSEIYASYGKNESRLISMETNAITKEVLYVVYNNNMECFKTSDLDNAITRFNEL